MASNERGKKRLDRGIGAIMKKITLYKLVKANGYSSNITKDQISSDVEYEKKYGWEPYLVIQGTNSTIVILDKEKNL